MQRRWQIRWHKTWCKGDLTHFKTCLPAQKRRRAADPAQAMDEITEFTRDQWDWLMGRFTRKED